MRKPHSCKSAARLDDSNTVGISRQPLPGYKGISVCTKLAHDADGSIEAKIFYEVVHCRWIKSKRRKTQWNTAEEAVADWKKEQAEHATAAHAAAGLFEQVSHLSLAAAGKSGTELDKRPSQDRAAPHASKKHSQPSSNSSSGPRAVPSGSTAACKAVAPQQHHQQQVQQQHSELASTSCQASHVIGTPRATPPGYDETYLLHPEQHVQLQLLEKGTGLLDHCLTQHVQQLRVVGLLGAGGVNEVHEVEQLLAAADDAAPAASAVPGSGEVAPAALPTTASSCSSGGARLAFKLPLPYNSPLVPQQNRQRYPMRLAYYRQCERLLLKEASIMSQLAGEPGIMRCHGVGAASFTTRAGLAFSSVAGLLLELGELGSVQQQLTPGPGLVVGMEHQQAWRVVLAAAHALDAVHSVAGCVYEDLKPANICCTGASGEVEYKLIDFSSCVQLQDGRAPPQAVGGTVGYMAPEAEAGLEHSVTADTWSLGALLLALRTGRRPWFHLASLQLSPAAAAIRRTYEELLQVPLYQKAFSLLELSFLQKALEPAWQQRPTVRQLLNTDPYLRHGTEDQAAAADRRADIAAYAVAGLGVCRQGGSSSTSGSSGSVSAMSSD